MSNTPSDAEIDEVTFHDTRATALTLLLNVYYRETAEQISARL